MKANVTLINKTVTVNELETILASMPNSIGTFAQIEQLTVPKILTKDRQTKVKHNFGLVQKLSSLKILLSTDYVSGVTNQLKREDKAVSEYKKGANTMPLELCENNNFFGYFKGKAVIQYRPFDNSFPTVKYLHNGKEIDKAELGDILPAKSKAKNQGTDKEIFWRKLYVSNIVSITLNGIRYQVKENVLELA
jgi:hypothetical protein